MKIKEFKYLIISLFIFAGCQSESNSELKENLPSIQAEAIALTDLKLLDRLIDAGTILEDTTLVAKFFFQNSGSANLIIESVEPDCTCTGYILSQDTLRKGEKGYLELMVDTKGKYGPVSVNATIKANTETKFYNVKLKADIAY